ncbi:MAG: DUF4492 domain-containing protein [Desulfocapsaceae bacterium]|nr:DUF4492 domain-containing protein [Desulfocapsaceae bacterium]
MKEIFLRWQRLIIQFYFDGFRAMTVGRTLWKVILIKIFILFAILKMFFFPDYLRTHFSTDQQRSEHVLEQMTGQSVMRTGGNNK